MEVPNIALPFRLETGSYEAAVGEAVPRGTGFARTAVVARPGRSSSNLDANAFCSSCMSSFLSVVETRFHGFALGCLGGRRVRLRHAGRDDGTAAVGDSVERMPLTEKADTPGRARASVAR